MKFLFVSDADRAEDWSRALADVRPDMKMSVYPDIDDPSTIDYALVWRPPPGLLANLPNLKLIFSVGAGVDSLIEDTTLPAGAPLASPACQVGAKPADRSAGPGRNRARCRVHAGRAPVSGVWLEPDAEIPVPCRVSSWQGWS